MALSPSAEEVLAKKRELREEHWYAVAVASQHERKIVETLKSKGKEAYVPVRQEKHRWSDRMKIVDVVLTPQIIFVRNSMDKKNEVFVNHNVKCYIYAPGDNRPCPITDERMRDFMRLIDKNYEFKLTAPVVGEDVMVLEGPLKGLVGELVKVEAETALPAHERCLRSFGEDRRDEGAESAERHKERSFGEYSKESGAGF